MDYLLTLLDCMGKYQAAINAAATIGIFFVALMTFIDNWKLRRANTKPRVVAYLEQDSHFVNFLNFSLENVGHAAAHNVSICIYADEEDFASHGVQIRKGNGRTPIGTFPKGGKIKTELGSRKKLFKDSGLKPFEVVIDYEDIKGKKYRECFSLNVLQFSGNLGAKAPSVEYEMVDTLKKIEQHLEKIFRCGSSQN